MNSEISATYNSTRVNPFLDTKPDDSELAASLADVNTSLVLKQTELILGEVPSNTGREYKSGCTKFPETHCVGPLTIT